MAAGAEPPPYGMIWRTDGIFCKAGPWCCRFWVHRRRKAAGAEPPPYGVILRIDGIFCRAGPCPAVFGAQAEKGGGSRAPALRRDFENRRIIMWGRALVLLFPRVLRSQARIKRYPDIKPDVPYNKSKSANALPSQSATPTALPEGEPRCFPELVCTPKLWTRQAKRLPYGVFHCNRCRGQVFRPVGISRLRVIAGRPYGGDAAGARGAGVGQGLGPAVFDAQVGKGGGSRAPALRRVWRMGGLLY